MKRENVLIEALPYIREFHGSTVVIKIGGDALVDRKVLEEIVEDIVLLQYVGIIPIVVHGGGQEITQKMEESGKKPEFIAGVRITDEDTLEIAKMVLIGKINNDVVCLIGKYGSKGIGLSGKDGGLIVARKKEPMLLEGKLIDIGFVGEIERINTDILSIVCEKGYIPVISPIAVDGDGNSLNVNADITVGEIASAMHAKKLIILTGVPGVLMDENDENSVISEIRIREIDDLMRKGVIKSGMIPKLEASVRAIKSNVGRAHIIDSRREHALLLEIFTEEGIGTMIY
jgi:acetylglutamate kinase